MLAEAHSLGMIHRDIKPQNILLDEVFEAKLTDFDLVGAKNTTGGTRTGAMGTAIYAAPECLERPQEATARVDVFGLGMTAIFCLAGKPLTLSMLRNAEPTITRLDCLPTVKEVLRRAVAWEPEARYADASAMVSGLRAAMMARGASRADDTPWVADRSMDDLPGFSGDSFAKPVVNVSIQSRPTNNKRMYALIGSASLFAVTAVVVLVLLKINSGSGDDKSVAQVASAMDRAGATPDKEPGAAARRPAETKTADTAAEPKHSDLRPTAAPTNPVLASVIHVEIHVSPPTARVSIDDQEVGGNLFAGQYVTDYAVHQVRASAPGYVSKSLTVGFDANVKLELSLERLPYPPVVPAPTPSMRTAAPQKTKEPGEPKPSDSKPPAAPTNPVPAPVTHQPELVPPVAKQNVVDVEIRVSPDSARISIDGQEVGGNQFSGQYVTDNVIHSVRAKAPGYVAQSVQVAFNANVKLDLSLDRAPPPVVPAPTPSGGVCNELHCLLNDFKGVCCAKFAIGYAAISSNPSARIWIDGKDTGLSTPIVGHALPLAPGKHKVTFVIDAERFTFSVTIKAGETATLHKALGS